MYLIVENHSGNLTVILFIWSRSRNYCTRPASNILLRRLEQLPAQRVETRRCGLIDGAVLHDDKIIEGAHAVEEPQDCNRHLTAFGRRLRKTCPHVEPVETITLLLKTGVAEKIRNIFHNACKRPGHLIFHSLYNYQYLSRRRSRGR